MRLVYFVRPAHIAALSCANIEFRLYTQDFYCLNIEIAFPMLESKDFYVHARSTSLPVDRLLELGWKEAGCF